MDPLQSASSASSASSAFFDPYTDMKTAQGEKPKGQRGQKNFFTFLPSLPFWPLFRLYWRFSSSLSPFALQSERGPVIRRLPLTLPPHLDLRRTQGRRRTLTILEYLLVELRHQLRGGFVIDVPEADHNARRPCVHKTARQSHQSFAFDIFAEPRPAGAQHDQFGG